MGNTLNRAGGGESISFDHLLLTLFRSVDAERPWTEFLLALCEQLNACAGTLVLRQPARGDRGILFDVNAVQPLVEIYRTSSFPDDPFLGLEEGTVSNLYDRVSAEELHCTRYHNELLKLDRVIDILALSIAFGDGYVGSLKLARRDDSTIFGLPEKSLLMRLYPHLKTALGLYDRGRRDQLEKMAYIKAIDQLAFGVIILNERGHIVRINETASQLIESSRLVKVEGNTLRGTKPLDESRLAKLIAAKLASKVSGESATGSLKLVSDDPDRSLYLLLTPIHDSRAIEDPAFGLAVYLSSGLLQRKVAIDACATLYGFSRAEVALLTQLVDGSSILAASTTLGISEHTARTQLRSMFGKTNTHRQADLIRLVLTSLAIIA